MKPTWSLAWLVLIALLLAVRLPSLVQPPGADQELYAYVAQEIHRGGLPYRDAWDQKPPGIHFVYAALWSISGSESVIPAADLAAAAAMALLLVVLGRRLKPGAGELAAVAFLLLGNPALDRFGGVRIRAQCETFIALTVTGAFLMAHVLAAAPASRSAAWRRGLRFGAGLLLGAAFVLKYNAAVFAPAAVIALLFWRMGRGTDFAAAWRETLRDGLGMAAGFCAIAAVVAAAFATAGAWDDLWQATVVYNLQYSGETYRGPWHMLTYLLTFPIERARVDGLWLLGGAGCLLLMGATRRRPGSAAVLAWVGAACLSIAVNGSRGLPQYFVQADPALALAAGLGGAAVWQALRHPLARTALLGLIALALWRVVPFDKAVDYTRHDLAFARGAITRDAHLARYGGRPGDKHSPLAVAHLADALRATTAPEDRVLVFGFSPGALVQSDRRSASRFFWSRPLIVGFNEGRRGYGPSGLLEELGRHEPAVVALQVDDWQLEGTDSATYFMSQPALAAWLGKHYHRAPDLDEYRVWRRVTP